MKKTKILKLTAYIIFGVISLNLFGCATNGPPQVRFRSAEVLLQKNPIEKIVILGEARLMRPRMGGKSAALSLSGSKLFLEDSMPKLKKAMLDKGYEVVLAEPMAIGYKWHGGSDYWIYNYTAKNGEPSKWQSSNGDPAFEYPIIEENKNLSNIIRAEYEGLNKAAYNGRLLTYDPVGANLSAIGKAHNADTVCFARLWGERYSAGRMAGDLALTAVAALFGGHRRGLVEAKRVNIICAESSSGRVLFQDSFYSPVDPLAVLNYPASDTSTKVEKTEDDEDDALGESSLTLYDAFFDVVVAKMPRRGESLPASCRLIDRVRMRISCDDKTKPVSEDTTY